MLAVDRIPRVHLAHERRGESLALAGATGNRSGTGMPCGVLLGAEQNGAYSLVAPTPSHCADASVAVVVRMELLSEFSIFA